MLNAITGVTSEDIFPTPTLELYELPATDSIEEPTFLGRMRNIFDTARNALATVSNLVTGETLFNAGVEAGEQFGNAVGDFINPDYNDPTSVGANFWDGVYDDVIYAGEFWKDKTRDAFEASINYFQENVVEIVSGTQNTVSKTLRSDSLIRITNDVFRGFINTEFGQRVENRFWGYGTMTIDELIAERCAPPAQEAETRIFIGIDNDANDAQTGEKIFNEPYDYIENPNSLLQQRNQLNLGHVDVVALYTKNEIIDSVQVFFNTVLGIKTPATKIIAYYNNKPIKNEFFHSGAGCADLIHGNHNNNENGYYFGDQVSLSGAHDEHATEVYIGEKDWVARLYLLPPLPYNDVIHVPGQNHDFISYIKFKAERRRNN